MKDKQFDINKLETLSVNVDDSINLINILEETLESVKDKKLDNVEESCLTAYEFERLLPRMITLCDMVLRLNTETHEDIYRIVNQYLKD